jgi:hypothetical protein
MLGVGPTMAASTQVVNLVVLFFFIVVGAVIEVLVSIILGALVCVIPLVVFAMFSPTSRSTPIARSLRQSPLMVLEVVVGASGFMVMIGAGAAADLVGILIGLVLFIVGLVLLAPRLRAMPRPQGQPQQPGQPSLSMRPTAQTIPPGVYGQPSVAPLSSTYPPATQAVATPTQYPPSRPPSQVGPSSSMAERYCPACGEGNARTAGSCQRCGAPLLPSP